jgi:FG-GAP-like repeat
MTPRLARLAGGCAVVIACAGCAQLRFLGPRAPSTSAPSFARPRHYSTGPSPQSVAIADLDRDGKPDLAVGGDGDATVSVLKNVGGGRFQDTPEDTQATGGRPGSIAAGDLTGDGAPDLVTANADPSSVSVLVNDGLGAFDAHPPRNYRVGPDLVSVAIGDVNGDGKPDLAVADDSANTASVLMNIGGGRFRPKVDYPAGRGPIFVAIGDLNGDGAPDLAVADWVGRGSPSFSIAATGRFGRRSSSAPEATRRRSRSET